MQRTKEALCLDTQFMLSFIQQAFEHLLLAFRISQGSNEPCFLLALRELPVLTRNSQVTRLCIDTNTGL